MPYKDPEMQKAYSRVHYKKNKAAYLASNNNRRRLLKEKIVRLKENTPCTDCRVSYPHYVMDFDHLRDKTALIMKFVRDNNKTGLEKELEKCEIVCSNCHRLRTHSRMLKRLE